jgi:hypothetical protein
MAGGASVPTTPGGTRKPPASPGRGGGGGGAAGLAELSAVHPREALAAMRRRTRELVEMLCISEAAAFAVLLNCRWNIDVAQEKWFSQLGDRTWLGQIGIEAMMREAEADSEPAAVAGGDAAAEGATVDCQICFDSVRARPSFSLPRSIAHSSSAIPSFSLPRSSLTLFPRSADPPPR